MKSDSVSISHVDSSTSIPAARQLWEVYLADQQKSEYTIKAFMGDLGLVTQFLPPGIAIGDVTTHDLNRFIDWLKNGRGENIPCSPKSLSRRITTLKSFFRWLFDNGRIKQDPAEKILQQTVISPLPEVLTQEEIEKARSAALKLTQGDSPDARPAALFLLLLETGIKKSECLNMKLSHIAENGDNYLFVRYADGRDRNKERKIPLSEEYLEIFNQYVEQYAPEEKVFPWSPRRLEYLLEDISSAANLEKHISFSMCRWNCALGDWQSGMEKNAIRQKLGISKIQWREIKMKLKQLNDSTD